MSRRAVFTILASVFAVAATPASAGTIFFESFEKPNVKSWAVFQSAVGDNAGWSSLSGTGIEIQDQSIGITKAHHGSQYVELDSDTRRGGVPSKNTNSMMGVDVGLKAGQTYKISFAYKPRTNKGRDDNGISLFALDLAGTAVNDSELLLSASETRSTLSDWLVYSVYYTAKKGFNGIGFAAFGLDNSLGGFIDSVSVSEVPIPAALPLFGFGVAGIAALRRRRKAAA